MWSDLTPEHCQAARHLLGWDRARLARESGVSNPTVGRFERGEGDVTRKTCRLLATAFERNGVRFEKGEPRGHHVLCRDGVLVRLESGPTLRVVRDSED